MVMDELACPSRISDGEIVCVDCCAMLTGGDELSHSGFECPTDHDVFDDVDDWLLEIYSAYPPGSESELGPKGKRSPDNETVLAHMNQRMLREQFDFHTHHGEVGRPARGSDHSHISRDQVPVLARG